jgi:hypothetical protein
METTDSMSRELAEDLTPVMQQCCGLLDEAVCLASEKGSPEFVNQLRKEIVEAMFILGWNILEKMVYVHHPHLRPYALERSEPGVPEEGCG